MLAFDGVLVLGKELRRDRERALRELRARSAAAAIALRRGARAIASLEAPLRGQEEAGSALVARFLAELGVPADRLILAARTRSTREEALAGLEVAQSQGWKRTLVITSAYHVPRAQAYFAEAFGPGAAVFPPEALLRRANSLERTWILDGTPAGGARRREERLEATLRAIARALRPLPAAWRWELEVQAGALLRAAER